MLKLTVFVPETHAEPLKAALFAAGCGRVGKYEQCAWQASGTGQFRPLPGSRPFIGTAGALEHVSECRIELLCPDNAAPGVLAALRSAHPYEEPAYDFVRVVDVAPPSAEPVAARLKAALRDVPDFPKPGILFKDITPLLASPDLFREAVNLFQSRHAGQGITKVAAIDARGFLFGGALAASLGAGLIPIRKHGRLPWKTWQESYELEYGKAVVELHQDACGAGDRVLLFDDLLATGGTARAATRLLERTGATIVGIDFLVELAFLNGRSRLAAYDVFAPIVC